MKILALMEVTDSFVKFSIARLVLTCLILTAALPLRAESDWASVTLDNDLFVGKDRGYTNGFYVSLYDTGDMFDRIVNHRFWVTPLMWSMPKDEIIGAVNAYKIGQTLSTPSDINIVVPGENELPYSSLLAFTNSYITVKPAYADMVSTSIGIVGPAALGEETQKLVHRFLGSDEPQGWGTQLENELVFQLSRGRTWRAWVSESGHLDFLPNAEFAVGTISSAVIAGITVRYGRDLDSSYATTLLNSSRTANPSAVNGGWYVYGGIQAGYTFNQVFTDGNTFRDSRSIDYDHDHVGAAAGIAYSWQNRALAFTVNDSDILRNGSGEETLENLTQYGTITFAWRLD